jgi:hypothetical protein
MATERQIEANRKNAERSRGPKSDSGKARSRLNATKHGCASELPEVELQRSPEFEARRARWAAKYGVDEEVSGFAMDRAVAASLRVERCERAIENVVESTRNRAAMAWAEDRRAEAAVLAERLAKDPMLTSRRLQTSLAGVELMIEAWLGLASALQDGGNWSEAQASMALDLLGINLDLRSGPTLIDPVDGSEPVPYRKGLALEELTRLEALRDEAMVPLDELNRRHAMAGDIALLSKPATLMLRYERDAWRRYSVAIKEVRDQAGAPADSPAAIPDDPARVAPVPAAPPPSPSPSKPKAEAEAVAQPMPTARALAEVPASPVWVPISGPLVMPDPATERTQFDYSQPNRDLAWDRG